jgi:hypothetical protein
MSLKPLSKEIEEIRRRDPVIDSVYRAYVRGVYSYGEMLETMIVFQTIAKDHCHARLVEAYSKRSVGEIARLRGVISDHYEDAFRTVSAAVGFDKGNPRDVHRERARVTSDRPT